MVVKYLGHKKSMPVHLPVGAKTRSEVKKLLFATPYVELPDEDALALVKLDPRNFGLVENGTEIHTKVEAMGVPSEIHKKRGRPRKVALIA